jgi:hypothetical protein
MSALDVRLSFGEVPYRPPPYRQGKTLINSGERMAGAAPSPGIFHKNLSAELNRLRRGRRCPASFWLASPIATKSGRRTCRAMPCLRRLIGFRRRMRRAAQSVPPLQLEGAASAPL